MDLKALLGLTVVPAGILGGILLACLSKRIRDLYFVLLVFLSPMIEHLDVNFVSREWYRGTSRGFEVSLLDVFSIGLLVSSFLVPRPGHRRFYWPASFGWMWLFFLYACFTVAIADPQLFGYFELFKMLRGFILVLGVALYLQSKRELRLLVISVALVICYQCLLGLKQRYVDGVYRVPGSFVHENSLSVLLCLTTPLMVTAINSRLSKWIKCLCALAIPLAFVGVILTVSRAGVIFLPLVLLGATLATISYRLTARKVVLTLLIIAGASGAFAKAWNTLKERFDSSSLKQEYEDDKTMGRGYYLDMAKLIAAENWFGVGLNNWSYWVSNKYGQKMGFGFVPYIDTDTEPSQVIPPGAIADGAQAAPAHNLGALTLGELGPPGLALLTLLWVRWFLLGAAFLWKRTPEPMRRMGIGIFFGLLGLFLQSWTEWVFRQLGIYYMAHILVGALASLCFQKRQAQKAERRARLAIAARGNGQNASNALRAKVDQTWQEH